MTSARSVRERTWWSGWPAIVAAAAFPFALLLLQHPYHGIWHDSVLYLGQALAANDPATFQQDLFFRFGSQARFSASQVILALLVQAFPPGPLFLWLTLASLALFAAASWQLVRGLFPPAQSFSALLAVLILPTFYGAWASVAYAEPFFTGRSLGEPLILLSLAALVGGRRGTALGLWCAAAAVHPLQALPALPVAWIWLAQHDRRWLRLAWAIPCVAAAVLLPASWGLLDRQDSEWHAQIWQRNLVVFYSNSTPGDWYYLLGDLFIAAVAAMRAPGAPRTFMRAVLISTLLLFTLSLILADAMHLVWPSALQLWRAHWLLHWTTMASLPWLVSGMLAGDQALPRTRTLVFCATVAMAVTPANGNPLVPGTILLYCAWPWLSTRLSSPLRGALAIGVVLAAIAHLMATWALPSQWGYWQPLAQWPSPLLSSLLPVLVPLLAVAGCLGWRSSGDTGKRLLATGAIALLVLVGLQWDQRTRFNRAFTTAPTSPPFGVAIPADSQVQWIGSLLPAWNILHRPQYLDRQQLAGIVFNRRTSMEGFRRKSLLQVRDGQGQECRIVTFALEGKACNPDDVAVTEACAHTRGELDYFILPYPLNALPNGIWHPGWESDDRYYLYSCRGMLARGRNPRDTPGFP